MAEANLQPVAAPVCLSDDPAFSGIFAVGSKAQRKAEPDIRVSEEQAFSGVYQIERRREGARQLVSVIIVSALLFIVIASFIMMFVMAFRAENAVSVNDLRGVLEVLLAPVVGIVGAVTGFYFGSGSAMSRDTPGQGGRS